MVEPEPALVERIKSNLTIVRERIAAAASAAGRREADVAIVAVTKTQPLETVLAAAQAGLTNFGENYAQEAVGKIDACASPNLGWHFIGALQSNKAKLIVGRCRLIQSVDRMKLATRIDEAARDTGRIADILIEVHLGRESAKSGVEPDDLLPLYESIRSLSGVRVLGLMGMAPLCEPDGTRSEPGPYFESLRRLFEQLPEESRSVLSMGMSGDFEAAVSAGSNMVRIGSALFGSRPA